MKNIAILGFGTVGTGVYEVLEMNREKVERSIGDEFKVKKILDLKETIGKEIDELLTSDFDSLIADDEIDLYVETMGGVKPAFEFSKRILKKGKILISSNKELVEKHGAELMNIASESKGKYLFEASVGGGIPIIRPLSLCLAGNGISRIEGIVNGTTNYILTKMSEEGLSFDACLKDAQEKGYAESNPDADVRAYDAGRKIAIMTSIASAKNCFYDDVYVEGIDELSIDMIDFASSMEMVIKLVARMSIQDGKVSAIVSPFIMDKDEKLASVSGVFNAILVEGNALGEAVFYGQGAGKLATASAVVGDVVDAFSGRNYAPLWSEEKLEIVDKAEMKTRAFIIFKADDALSFEKKIGKKLMKNADYFAFFTDVMTEDELNKLIENEMKDAKEVKFVRARI